ncbi:MAG: fasciclin domain-containing protein [Moorea sp. SIO2B7]|nr:fasciclin domain-containing protein [Moorena sp. SIO2B7]
MNTKNWLKKFAVFVGVVGLIHLNNFSVLAKTYYPSVSFFQPTADYFQSEDYPDVAEILLSLNDFRILTSKLKEVGLVESLTQQDILTIFAPTDEAFNALTQETRQKLSQKQKLRELLQYHLVSGVINEDDLKRGEIATFEGSPVKITINFGANEVMLNDARGMDSIRTTNVIIILIDKVLLPPNF